MKIVPCVILCSFSLSLTAMEEESKPAQKTTYTVSASCYDAIDKINNDANILYTYLFHEFKLLGTKAHEEVRPSEFLKYFETKKTNIDEVIKLTYMPASNYLRCIVSKRHDQLDAEFQAKLDKTKNIQKTWEWFAEYFRKTGLSEPLAAYKMLLVKIDQKKLEQELAGKGIISEFIKSIKHQNNERTPLLQAQKTDKIGT